MSKKTAEEYLNKVSKMEDDIAKNYSEMKKKTKEVIAKFESILIN